MTEQQKQGYGVLLAGVDTLVLNVRYANEEGRPLKQELAPELGEMFDQWQALARQEEGLVPTPFQFGRETLHIYPHGAGKGQWRWLLVCPAFTLAIGRGRLNGIIAQVRFSSEYLWTCEDDQQQFLAQALVEVMDFLYDLLGPRLHYQVSEVHLCADIVGWDVASCSWQSTFLSRARRRVDRAEGVVSGGAGVAVVNGRRLATLEFGTHGSPLSGVIYNKSKEIETARKQWFRDLWARKKRDDGSPLWDGEAEVWRVEFRFKREALHELKEEGVFHGVEDAHELPERLEALWTYAAGHAGRAADGLPDGWLRYALPSDDTNIARWEVHPVWRVVQEAFRNNGSAAIEAASAIGAVIRERKRQANVLPLVRQIAGCCSTMAAWLGGYQDDRAVHAMVGLGDDLDPIPVPDQIYDPHFSLHWLEEKMPYYVLLAQAARVNPEKPDILYEKYRARYADDVRKKRVLYGLQAEGASTAALASDSRAVFSSRDRFFEITGEKYRGDE